MIQQSSVRNMEQRVDERRLDGRASVGTRAMRPYCVVGEAGSLGRDGFMSLGSISNDPTSNGPTSPPTVSVSMTEAASFSSVCRVILCR